MSERQFGGNDGMRRKRIETRDAGSVARKNEHSGQVAFLVLARTLLQPLVQFGHAAMKSCPVVTGIEWFDSEFSRKILARHYLPAFL